MGRKRFRVVVTIAVLASALLAISVFAQAPPDSERFLLPVTVIGAAGAYGTVWDTELWYRNNSGKPLQVGPLWVTDHVPTVGITEYLTVSPRPAEAPGQFLWVTRDGSEKVLFDLRVFNLADRSGDFGTKVPVVREEEFLDAVDLINVPSSTGFRCALRVYALDETVGSRGTVIVSIYSNAERKLASAELPLTGSPRYAAMLSLADVFPEIRAQPRVRVHVEPRDAGAKLWAFVSVVSNQTQHVSVVTP